jgi:hypothetical protein
MSIKGDIFKAISTHLMAQLQFTEAENLPNLIWVDKDFGQAELIQEGIVTLPMPAILVSFKTPKWVSRLSQTQSGETFIRIRILFENYADSFQGSINQDKAIQFFEFNEKTHIALQNFQGDNFTSLQRNSDEEDDDHNNVVITDIYYTTIITDASAQGAKTTIIAEPAASAINTPIDRPENNTGHNWVIN